MRRGHVSDKALRQLLREYRAGLLLEREAAETAAVPEHVDRAAARAFREMDALIAAGATATVAAAPARAAGIAWKPLLLAAVAAGTVAAGAAAGPRLLRVAEDAAAHRAGAARVELRAPGDYVIPAPGPEFAVTEELAGDTMVYKWFTAGTREVLAEIAPRLPERPPEGAEYVLLPGGIPGRYAGDGDRKTLWLYPAGAEVELVFFDAEREDLFSYAEVFLEANP